MDRGLIDAFEIKFKSAVRNLKSAILLWVMFLALCSMPLAPCFPALAQQPKKVFRIGYIAGRTPPTDTDVEPIRLALRQLGYIEGQNIVIEYRYTDGKSDRYPELLADLVRIEVDLILVAGGDNLIRPAMKATKTIPLVLTGPGSDPVKSGFIESLARPGGNVTGITNFSNELGGKRLEILKEAIGKVTRVAVLYNPTLPGISREVKEDFPIAARALKLDLQPWEVRGEEDFDRVFALTGKQRPDGLYVSSAGSLMNANRKRINDLTIKNRLPSMHQSKDFVDAGGLMYYGVNVADSHRRIAYYVDRILKSVKPADLPVEQPTKFEFVINLKTAKQIGLTIPPEVLARATRIIR
jgi:putative tryptophan/tyrosine transport system substrate-binding protein